MKTYKVFEKGCQRVVMKQGWSWPAFFLQWIWAFSKTLILPGVVALAGSVVFALIPVKNIMNPYVLIAGIVFGLKGNKWWEGRLMKSGYSLLGTVQAKNPAEAVSVKL
jgi:hypothetical protein